MNDSRAHGPEHQAADRDVADAVPVTGLAAVRGDKIAVGSGDENVAKIQLAARWSEEFAPPEGDTLEDALRRFRRVYHYVDSITKLVEPDPS